MHKKDSAIYFLAGALSGIFSVLATYPIEVVKTRIQSSLYENQGYKALIRQMIQDEGFRSFYKGLVPTLLGIVPSRAIYFCIYSTSKDALNNLNLFRTNSPEVYMLSASLAGFIAISLTNPICFIRTRLQLSQDHISVWSCVRTVYQNEGLAGFYKGVTASYIGISENIIHFILYEYFRAGIESINKSQEWLRFCGFTFAGGVSSFVACCLTYPHEVLRTRLREEDSPTNGLFQTFVIVYREDGYRALYKGLTMQLIHSVPNSAITMFTYEFVIHLFDSSFATQSLVKKNS